MKSSFLAINNVRVEAIVDHDSWYLETIRSKPPDKGLIIRRPLEISLQSSTTFI